MSRPAGQTSPHELKLVPQAPSFDGRMAFQIDEFCRVTGVGRTSVYKALKEGKLQAVKAGSRTLILAESAYAYLHSLPPARPLASAAA